MKLGATGVLAIVGLAVGGYVVWKIGGIGAGLISGDNALTQNATDSNGNKVTAYQGVPVVGTLGAGANAISGGYLATFGSWLGTTTYDLLHPTEAASPPQAAYDETARLLARYPAPPTAGPESVFNGAGSFGQLGGLNGGTFDSTPFPSTYF